MKLNTVNVIQMMDGDISGLHSFTDDQAGNTEAEALFSEMCRENGSDEEDLPEYVEDLPEYVEDLPEYVEDLPEYVEDGCYDDDNGYAILLVHG